jgi:hypothetical protein
MAAHLLSGALALLAAPQGAAQGSAQGVGPGSAQGAAQGPLAEVLANVENQPLGAGRVADLDLPEDLLRRLSDRILRSSFEERFRIVVDAPAAQGGAEGPAGAGTPAARSAFRVVLDVLALAALAVLAALGFFAWRARARRRG